MLDICGLEVVVRSEGTTFGELLFEHAAGEREMSCGGDVGAMVREWLLRLQGGRASRERVGLMKEGSEILVLSPLVCFILVGTDVCLRLLLFAYA